MLMWYIICSKLEIGLLNYNLQVHYYRYAILIIHFSFSMNQLGHICVLTQQVLSCLQLEKYYIQIMKLKAVLKLLYNATQNSLSHKIHSGVRVWHMYMFLHLSTIEKQNQFNVTSKQSKVYQQLIEPALRPKFLV